VAFNPADIKAEMPLLAWRGIIDIPCRFANVAMSHVQAARPYPYLDVDGNEAVRRNSDIVTAELLFLNTLQENLYPDKYRQFITAVRDKKAGLLAHPAHGTMNAVVVSANLTYTAEERAGVTLAVTWKEIREDANTPPTEIDVPPDAKEVARSVDVQYEFVRGIYPSVDNGNVSAEVLAQGQALDAVYQEAFAVARLKYPDGEGGPSNFFDLVVSTFGDVQQEFIAISGKFAQVAVVVEKVSDAIELLQDPLLWPAQLEFRELHRAVVSLVELYAQGERPTGKFKAPREMPLDEVADQLGKRIDDLVQLNPRLLSSPWVAKDQTVTYYLD
jgi:hypothetical protein